MAMSAMMAPPPRVLVVFDYDWSLVDENSDTYVFRVLCPELLDEVPARRLQTPSWTGLMDELLAELATRAPHVTRADIERAVAEIPVQPRMLDAVRLAVEEHAADVKIISDANTIYIQSMLTRHGLAAAIPEVFTNPAEFDATGARLRVRPYHPLADAPHGCEWCPANMCKGRILDGIRQNKEYDIVIYVGDGTGDFCPSTRLSSRDVVFARADDEDGKSYGLLKKISAHRDRIQAQVVPWRTGDDILANFIKVLVGARQ